MKSFNLNFESYYSDLQRDVRSNKFGVYLAFVGKPILDRKVELKKLIYIGQIHDLKEL